MSDDPRCGHPTAYGHCRRRITPGQSCGLHPATPIEEDVEISRACQCAEPVLDEKRPLEPRRCVLCGKSLDEPRRKAPMPTKTKDPHAEQRRLDEKRDKAHRVVKDVKAKRSAHEGQIAAMRAELTDRYYRFREEHQDGGAPIAGTESDELRLKVREAVTNDPFEAEWGEAVAEFHKADNAAQAHRLAIAPLLADEISERARDLVEKLPHALDAVLGVVDAYLSVAEDMREHTAAVPGLGHPGIAHRDLSYDETIENLGRVLREARDHEYLLPRSRSLQPFPGETPPFSINSLGDGYTQTGRDR